jgi:mxaJ protein
MSSASETRTHRGACPGSHPAPQEPAASAASKKPIPITETLSGSGGWVSFDQSLRPRSASTQDDRSGVRRRAERDAGAFLSAATRTRFVSPPVPRLKPGAIDLTPPTAANPAFPINGSASPRPRSGRKICSPRLQPGERGSVIRARVAVDRILSFASALLFVVTLSAAPSPLRVCSDPNNLPFSNQQEQGFENRIAELLARDLDTSVQYYWFAQRRGFVRNTLTANKCDVIMGVPSSFEPALTTRPYYRSTYVFVTRKDRRLDVRSFDDPRLRKLKIGVQMIGDDYASSPPAHALANRGIVRNVAGYSVYGDYRQDSPPKRIVDAVAVGEVDVSAVWGPTAGYFIRRSRVPLVARPVSPEIDLPFLPFVFDISLAVRRGDTALRDKLEAILERRAGEIDAILAEYGVPRVDS